MTEQPTIVQVPVGLPGVNFTNDPNIPDVIELRDVSQTYDNGRTWIIEHLNLLIEDGTANGRFIVILGKSGCGKSTLLRYLAGLQPYTQGAVLINGRPRTPADRVAMVFQDYSSYEFMTVLDNVAFPLELQGVKREERHQRAMEMLTEVDLVGQEKKYAKPAGVSGGLSGGQLQRVAIARSLLANPSILLMDEPFGALDSDTRYNMQYLLMRIWQKLKCTIVFVTHDIGEAVFLADEIHIMSKDPGRIVQRIPVKFSVPRDRLLRRNPEYVALRGYVEDAFAAVAGPSNK